MAQWTFIDPNTLLPGDPWTSAKAQAAFENLEAVAEGAAGAPRLYGLAAVPDTNRSELQAVSGVSATDDWIDTGINIDGPLSGVFRVVTLSGTLRFSVIYATSVGGSGTLEIRRNGVVLQSWAQSGTATETRVLDAASVPADEWQWVIVPSAGGGGSLSNRQVGASDSYTRIGVPIRRSDLL